MIEWPAPDKWAKLYPALRGRQRLPIHNIRTPQGVEDGSLVFVSQISDDILERLLECENCLLLLNRADADACAALEEFHGLLFSEHPRYQFAGVLSRFWNVRSLRGKLTWQYDKRLGLGENVTIDPRATIEPDVTIAGNSIVEADVYIMSGARIGPGVRISQGTVVRENAVLGGYGFGFAREKGKPTIRIPHIGGVEIGRNVEIGALTTVCSGTISPTVIEDNVLIDDHVHVAHNCHIEKGTMITACAEISGSVRIGRGSWLAPNCSIIDRVSVGADCMVGIGAVVNKAMADGAIVVGRPSLAIQ